MSAYLPDRPAAELLAELPYFYKDDDKLSMRERQYRDVLVRLARAELALAEAEAYADKWRLPELRAALRASQGGQSHA